MTITDISVDNSVYVRMRLDYQVASVGLRIALASGRCRKAHRTGCSGTGESFNGAYNFSQAVLPLMFGSGSDELQYPPTLIFTGATAALKGGNGLGSFAMSKFAVRAMAQSLAREFGPKGIHVAHAIVDGIIDTEQTKGFHEKMTESKISPDQIAEAYWYLHTQTKTSFTHELDLRPYCESW
ncbi:hypothetical protein SI65_09498 [Aspergillus cristatus]|uniref:Uncharacterized protein n=1 Tax=Aspergillus cristatus TaxID=573508 RepID=A0A1E3B229_ASPCR|nr:hypothetical protein SI65_09498 [Aspergillus cristatus]